MINTIKSAQKSNKFVHTPSRMHRRCAYLMKSIQREARDA